MFSHFTASARRVMQRAFREAKHWRHDFVGTEHLLFALLCDANGPAFGMLHGLNANPNLMLDKVELSLQRHPLSADQERFPLSPALRRVFDSADAEAANFRHQLIAPEHLLLALARENECEAAQILASHGIRLDELRVAVARLPIDAIPELQVQTGEAKRDPTPGSVSALDLEDLVMPIQSVNYAPVQYAFATDIYAQLLRTQMVFACFAGFVLGYWTYNWQIGAVLALSGVGIAYLQRIALSILVGAVVPPILIVASGIWHHEQYILLPLVMLAGGFLGAYLCAPWQASNAKPSEPDNDELQDQDIIVK